MKNKSPKQNEIQEGTPTRIDSPRGSTTQGGSNFGQGSYQLGRYANAQGSESGRGSNYGNEQGWNNEALRMGDMDRPNRDIKNKNEKTGKQTKGDD